jgi:hypothetical protein
MREERLRMERGVQLPELFNRDGGSMLLRSGPTSTINLRLLSRREAVSLI